MGETGRREEGSGDQNREGEKDKLGCEREEELGSLGMGAGVPSVAKVPGASQTVRGLLMRLLEWGQMASFLFNLTHEQTPARPLVLP